VYVRRFFVADSIEERIIELQRRKKMIASAALCGNDGVDGGNASASNRPSLDDFKLLFQENDDDDEKKPSARVESS
jgi:SNF2 family DNA or RNA helicase